MNLSFKYLLSLETYHPAENFRYLKHIWHFPNSPRCLWLRASIAMLKKAGPMGDPASVFDGDNYYYLLKALNARLQHGNLAR